MALSSIFSIGLSALDASQRGMRVASQNISNANTPGYVRTTIDFAPVTGLSQAGGVEVSSVRRASDRFLAAASFIAQAQASSSGARAAILSRAQASFGDPNTASSLFSAVDRVWTKFSDLQVDPSSSLSRDDAVNAITQAFASIKDTSETVQGLIREADGRIADVVAEIQSLSDRISGLNDQIALTQRTGGAPDAAQNAQSTLIDQLSKLVDVRVEARADGGVNVRTGGGALLVGADAAQLRYNALGESYGSFDVIQLNPQLGGGTNLEPYVSGGELGGLLQARDHDLQALAEALGGFAAALGDQLNRVHNENTASPAASQLSGRQTGLLATDTLTDGGAGTGFTGKAVIGVTNSVGELSARHVIDFDARTITTEYPASVQTVTSFGNSIGALAGALNTALGIGAPAGGAAFADGVLSMSVAGGGGIALGQDAAAPSDREGRGFAHFFGLNDLAGRSNAPFFFDIGVSASDRHGLTAGSEISFTVRDGAGRVQARPSVAISGALAGATSTWGDLVAALNATGTGVGGFAQFAVDGRGQITMTTTSPFSVTIDEDTTTRGATGVSFSSLFGLTKPATQGRAADVTTRPEIANNSALIGVGRPDLTAAVGARVIESGDARGAAALYAAKDRAFSAPGAGVLSAQGTTLAAYASRLAGAAGRMASDADRESKGAASVAIAAADRRAEAEGVSLDEELLRMQTFQTSYAAAARVIQAANDMFDILFTIGAR